jgi:transmembrane sensor
MTRDPDFDETLLTHYVVGECTAEEHVAVERWVASSQDNWRRLAQVKRIWTTAQELPVSPVNVEAMSKRLRDALHQGSLAPLDAGHCTRETLRGAMTRDEKGSRSWLRQYRVGTALAFVLVLIGVGSAGIFSLRSTTAMRVPSSHHVYETRASQRATVTFADGSRAVLGPSTTLDMRIGQSGAQVDAHVHGQALFTVVPRQGRSFQVHAGNGVARVLGTTFLVRYYSDDVLARVFVADGRVSIRTNRAGAPTADAQGAVLSASMLGTIDDSGTVRVMPQVSSDAYIGWTSGRLVFRDMPVREALIEVGRAYGVEIRVADSTVAKQPLNATISLTKQSLSDVLESLSDVLDVHSVRTRGIITLIPGRAAVRRPAGPFSPYRSESEYGK